MFLMIDNYDSFVYNLMRYFLELGEEIKVYRNDAISIDFIKNMKPEGIILSPGPKDPEDSGICEDIVRTFSTIYPILGICLGHQIIAHALGASIIKGKQPMHGKITPIYHNGSGIFKDLKNPIHVTRYHSLIVDPYTLPTDFIITATSDDQAIMGIKHKHLLLEGVQFHPEAELTECGHHMLKNFIQRCKEVQSNDE